MKVPFSRKRMIIISSIIGLIVVTIVIGLILKEMSGKSSLSQNSNADLRGKNLNSMTENEKIIFYLENSDIVKDLPKSAVIELKLGSQYYTITKNSVSPGRPTEPDLSITVPESYAEQLDKGLCEVTKSANTNKELIVETHKSEAALLWRYSGMMKYRECLGGK